VSLTKEIKFVLVLEEMEAIGGASNLNSKKIA
jgi:hypothetical protein